MIGTGANLSFQKSFPANPSSAATCESPNGWLRAIRYPNGVVTTFAYDDSGRLTGVAAAHGAAGLVSRFEYDYDADGNKTAMREWNAVPACRSAGWDAAAQTTTYQYDGQGRLTGVDYPDGRHAAYTYDGVGNRLTEEETVPAAGGGVRVVKQRTFAYDGRNRVRFVRDLLRGDRSVAYAWNARGDLVTKTTGQLDGDGAVVPGTERQRLAFTWDRAGRLRAVAKAVPGSAPVTVAEFGYDASGRRVWKAGTSFRPDGTAVHDLRRYVHDGEAILAELGESPGGGYHPVQRYLHGIGVLARERLGDAAGVRTRRPDADSADTQYPSGSISRVVKPGSGRPVRTLEAPDADRVPTHRPGAVPGLNSPSALQTLFHHADGLNSTVNVTGADGSVKNAYRYDAWGNNRELEAGGTCLTAPDLGFDGFADRDTYLVNLASAFAEDDNRLTFTGLETDPETGLLFAQSRFYDPEAGRFLSEDSDPGDEGAPVSLHRYLYANASPTRFVDPSGRSSEDTVPTASLETGDLGSSESAARPSADQELPEGGSLAAYEVAKSKSRWPLTLSRSAPQHQGIWPECVSRAMDQWQAERDPDFEPIAKLRRAYHQARSMARQTYERTLRYAEDQWQQLKSDPFGFAGRKLNDIGELTWNLTGQPVIDAYQSGRDYLSDPSWERFGKFGLNTVMALPMIGSGLKVLKGGAAVATRVAGKIASLWARKGTEELGERLLVQGAKSEITQTGEKALAREAYEIGVPKGYQGRPGAMWVGEKIKKESSIAKLNDVDYIAYLSSRLSQRAIRQSISKSSGTEAGFLAETIFRSYSVRLNASLEEAKSFYRLFLQQAARRTGPNAGRRVTAWNTFTGRWRFNTKRLDWIISDISSRKNYGGKQRLAFSLQMPKMPF